MPTLRAELLFTPDCPHADRAETLLRHVLATEGVTAPIERVPIDDLDHAAGLGFHGSPTIRLDGIDVAPGSDDSIALACRRYAQPDGTIDGVPPEAAIRDALHARLAARAPRPGPMARAREVPGHVMRAGFVWASQRDSLEHLTKRLPLTRGLVRRFIAGEDLPSVLTSLTRLHEAGFATTVDVLGESVTSEADASAASDRYIELLSALVERGLDANVSLKLTQMGLDIDPAACRRTVGRVVDRAVASGAFVRVDMEDHTRTEATLAIARELFQRHGNVGVVIQSYLRRSAADVEALIADGMRVRLCKGAYNEPASVAFSSKAEVDDSYVRLTERLLRDGTYPAIATHDERIIAHTRAFAAREGIGPERFEFQMLYGIRRDLQEGLIAAGYRVRVYVPFGREWYPYFMRRLAERPANVLFIIRNLVREGRR